MHIGTISFPFIVTLIVVLQCLEVTRPLTMQLQESAIDAGSAREKESRLYVHLKKLRNEVDVRHKLWYQEAVVSIAESVQTGPQIPRIAGRQFHHANMPVELTSELLQFPFWMILGPKFKRDFPKLILM